VALPLREAVGTGLAEIVHLPHEHVRANQFLAVLTDKVRSRGVRRLVLDSASHIAATSDELEQILYGLAARFKTLGVTSVITLESPAMYSTDSVPGGGFSPVADNVIMLRYAHVAGANHPSVAVVKTRGSEHDRGTYFFEIGKGGVRIGDPVGRSASAGATVRRAKAMRRRR